MTFTGISAVIWDLDGTLTDSMGDIAAAANAALAIQGLSPHSVDSYRLMVGNGVRVLLHEASGGASPEVQDTLLKDYFRLYNEGCLNLTAPYANIIKVTSRLKECGICQLVVTNKPQSQSEKIVSALFAQDTFMRIYGQKDGFPTKPDPMFVNEALAYAGVSPEQAVFVGDSDVDVMTAHNAGLPCIGAGWGFRGSEELIQAGAERVISDPLELVELLNIH